MKHKPTEEILIAYLYGELEVEEMARVEEYLEAHPEEKSKIQELSDTRMIINELGDEPLPEPLGFINPVQNTEWLYWRKYVAIAATLLLILSFGWLSGFKVNYDENGLYLGFGEIEQGISMEQVADLINEDRASLLEFMETNMRIANDSLNDKFVALQAGFDSDEIVKKIFEQEKDALVTQMIDLNDKLSGNYREILRQIVVNFSNNLETQRIEDLRNIQAAFTDLEEATINKQFELEDALSDLEEKVNTVVANNSNNN